MSAVRLSMGPLSLSGIRLEGHRTVRLAYFDEAGISKAKDEPFVVVAGVVINGDSVLNGVKSQLDRLMHRHIPSHHQDGFIFHAMELFNGGGRVFKRLKPDEHGPPEFPLSRRLEIACDIGAVLKKFKLPVAIGFVKKSEFPKSFTIPDGWTERDKVVAAHVSAYLSSAMMVEHWMRQNASDENCLMIVEDNDQVRQSIRELQTYHQDKKIEKLLTEKERQHFPLRRIQEDPLFQPKRQSNPLILADFCAYVFKKKLMNNDRYEPFFESFRELLIVLDEAYLERIRKKSSRAA